MDKTYGGSTVAARQGRKAKRDARSHQVVQESRREGRGNLEEKGAAMAKESILHFTQKRP